jgi:hypothetical protein
VAQRPALLFVGVLGLRSRSLRQIGLTASSIAFSPLSKSLEVRHQEISSNPRQRVESVQAKALGTKPMVWRQEFISYHPVGPAFVRAQHVDLLGVMHAVRHRSTAQSREASKQPSSKTGPALSVERAQALCSARSSSANHPAAQAVNALMPWP